MAGYVVAGIGTEVGKTVTAAVLVESLDADYWKPVQAGELNNTDSDKIHRLASGEGRKIHAEAYRLKLAMSPHAAAMAESVTINLPELELPRTDRDLIVEIAGGLMVPLATELQNIDVITYWGLPVILVSRYYLGSINHTLLSIELLRQRGIKIVGIVFNGETVASTRSAIIDATHLPVVLEMPIADGLNPDIVAAWATSVRL